LSIDVPKMAAEKVSMKLFIDKKCHRVLFAEVDKEFVDFLFNIFTLPVGTVTRLLQKQNMTGCLHSLYESIENLNDIYLQPVQVKNSVLSPKIAVSRAEVPLLLPSLKHSYTARNIYGCGHCFKYTADDCRAICPSCEKTMTCKLTLEPSSVEQSYIASKFYRCRKNCRYVANNPMSTCPLCRRSMFYLQSYVAPPKPSSSGEGGYVKGVITYMVMDDLDVKPMSAISFITLLDH
jgi:hypothetical protein